MTGKRVKRREINKKRVILLIFIILILIIVVAIAIYKCYKNKSKDKKETLNNQLNSYASNETINSNNSNINNINNDENTTNKENKLNVMAYIDKTKEDKEIKNEEIFNSSIFVYNNNGTIEKITKDDGTLIDGTYLEKDGNYIITAKCYDSNEYELKVTIDTVTPTIIIDTYDIIRNEEYNIGSVIKYKNEDGIHKVEKAILKKYDKKAQDATEEPIDITLELREKGFTINEKGNYEIELYDVNGSKIDAFGANEIFIIK